MAKGFRCPNCERNTYHKMLGDLYRCSNCGYGLAVCSNCGKTVPPTLYCIYCASSLKEGKK